MIVDSLTKNKNGSYNVIIDGKSYTFDEEIVVEYRLVKGKEVSKDSLSNALSKNELMEYYYKALNYSINYGKNSNQLKDYLREKGLEDYKIALIIDMLISNKAIDDKAIIISITNTYIRKSYGKLLIKQKLIERKFSKDLIEYAISNIDYDLYYDSLNKLYNKVKNKYDGDKYTKKMKLNKYLASKGYTFDDISSIVTEE